MTGAGLDRDDHLAAPAGPSAAREERPLGPRAGAGSPPAPRLRIGRWAAVALLLALTLLGLGSAGYQLWAHYHFRQARNALLKYHPGDASRHLANCLRAWPHDPATLLLAAQAARRGDNVREAEDFLRAYRRYGGDPADDEYALEEMLLRAQQGEVDPVLRRCQEMVERHHPDSPRILEALARGYFRTYRVAAARVTVNIWLDRYPDDPQAVNFAGWAKEYYDAPDQAALDYLRVLEQDPRREDVRFRLAQALLDSAKPAKALEVLDGLCRRHPDHLSTRVLRARALFAAGRAEEARADLDALLAEHPHYPPALTERGRVANQQRDPEAEKWLRQAVALAPGDAQAWYLLSLVLARRGKGKGEEAEAALARFKQLQADQQRIRDIARREISSRPDDPALLHEVGTLLLRGGERLEAIRWFKKALEKDPGHKPTHASLADYYQKVGQIGLAARHRQKAGLEGDGGKK